MAYITAEQTKALKIELSKKFPNLKISVRNDHYSVADISITEGNIDFSDILEGHDGYRQCNGSPDHYGKHSKLFGEILDIAHRGNHDNSDIMTDYFDVGWYVHLNVGKWDKPYTYIA